MSIKIKKGCVYIYIIYKCRTFLKLPRIFFRNAEFLGDASRPVLSAAQRSADREKNVIRFLNFLGSTQVYIRSYF